MVAGLDQLAAEPLDRGRLADAGHAGDADAAGAAGRRQQGLEKLSRLTAVAALAALHQRDGAGEAGTLARPDAPGEIVDVDAGSRHGSS